MNRHTPHVRWRPSPARRPAVAASVFSAAVLLVAWATMAALLHWQWKETLNAQMRQNTNTAVAFKEHTLRILDTVDQAILRAQNSVRDGHIDGQTLVGLANETGMTPHILAQLSFVDAHGIFQGSNLDPQGERSKHVSLMDREHIRVHLQPDSTTARPMQNGLFISKPLVGKVSGVRTIQLSRKIFAEDGSTLGVIVASLNQNHFIQTYQGANFGSQGGIVVAGLDGALRVRVIGGENTDIAYPLPSAVTEATRLHTSGALVTRSSDGVERIIGFSRVGDYDLTVQTGTSTQEAFASWRGMRDMVLLLTLLLSVAVVVFVTALVGGMRRLAYSHEALQKSEAEAQRANQAKSEFLAAMSHELRTPLTSIRGFAELLETRSQDALVRSQAGLIRQGAEHLNALLTEILDLAKIEAGAMSSLPEPVNLRELVHEVAQLYQISAEAKSLALTNTTADSTPATITTDRLKLKQILGNLLSNAIKFTSKGSISLAVRPGTREGWVLFGVTDTGPGIAPALHEVIFEKFSQGSARVSYQHGGTGLGLPLSRALAELLGGTLTVQSGEGQGATFTLALPLTPPGAPRAPTA